jgi:glucose/arabinose dehydrogenase
VEQLEDRLAPATVPIGYTLSQVANGLVNPTLMEFAPDGRLFVSEQGGDLRVIKNGVLLPTPFVHINVDSSGERGLLGIAFDPQFTTDQYVYVYYTVPGAPAHNRVSRFTANGDTAVAGREVDIFDLDPLSSATNHNGGSIHFGADGKLYISAGENANPANSQSLTSLLGKILRINPDGTIPADNPFVSQTTGKDQAIWALGLRNPFTFAVQPGTGRIFIDDVGSSPPQAREEIDDGIAGSNYGWPYSEGFRQPGDTPTTFGTYRDPLYAYDHSGGSSAIVGGAFYDPASMQFPSYHDDYFFADLGGGYVKVFNPTTHAVSGFATGINLPTDVLVSSGGSLYILSRGDGAVYKVQYTTTWTNLGGSLRSVAWGTNQAGQQEVFAIATDSALWTRTESHPGTWSPWTSLAGRLLSLTTGQNADGRLEVFAIAADNALWTRTEMGGGLWSNWTLLGGNLKQITLAANADGRLEVFAIAADNALWTRTQTAANASTWTSWVPLSGNLMQITVAANADGRLEVFAVAADNALWTRTQTAANSTTWTPWNWLAGNLKQIALGTTADGRLEVFAIAADNALWTRTETATNASTWTPWNWLAGNLEQIAVAANTDGRLQVFAIAADNALWTRSQTAANSDTWNSWVPLGGSLRQIVSGKTAGGQLETFGIGQDNTLWQTVLNIAV